MWRHKFQNELYLSNQAVFSTLLKRNFFIIFKELLLKQIKQLFLEGGSPPLNKVAADSVHNFFKTTIHTYQGSKTSLKNTDRML